MTFFRDRKQRPFEWAGRESKLGRIRGGVKNWLSTLMMRTSAAEYRSLHLRAHELLHDVPLYDVSSVDLPGGGSGRTIADIRTLESATPPSHIATLLYGLRYLLGRVFGWDREPMQPEDSFLERLSQRDRCESQITSGTLDGPFWVLYQFPGEALCETRNETVHGFICTALVSSPNGYILYWGSTSAARRGLRDRTSLRSNHFAAFCIQQCFAAFVARGLLLTSARAETILPADSRFCYRQYFMPDVSRMGCGQQ